MKKIDVKPICCNLCMLWGRCIYSDQHAFIAILSIDNIQPPEFNITILPFNILFDLDFPSLINGRYLPAEKAKSKSN